jgi:hypothetical protein
VGENKWQVGIAVALCISCFFCSVGTSFYFSNYPSGIPELDLLAFIIIVILCGFAGLITGILVGRNIIICTQFKLTLRYKVFIYISVPVLFVFIFLAGIYIIAKIFLLI